MESLHGQNFFSTSEVATILNVTRITIFRRIKDGSLKATKIGRNYAISHEELMKHLEERPLSELDKEEIKKLVDKTIADYGDTIRMLGRE
jgi:excisionase family DNA binding protein